MNRKEAEMQFHDARERDHKLLSQEEWQKKYSNKKWYSITRKSRDFVNMWLQSHVRGKRVLDYGCGLGESSIKLARMGAQVSAIDISPESVATTNAEAKEAGFAHCVNARVMDAEKMSFESNSFDVIVCSGVLHHMDVRQAFPELSRVLKPTGYIIAIEALGYNPLINWYRERTPHLRTEWEKDHILTNKELKIARDYFVNLEVHYFHLVAIGAVFLRNTILFKPSLAIGNLMDTLLLKIFGVQLMAWQMVFILSKPKK